MAVRVIKWTDTSAPLITGEDGTLVNWADKVLKDGFGATDPLGWTKPFAGTSKGAYQMPVGSNGHILRINDAAVDGSKSAQVRAYMAMTDIDTGTDPFPTVAQEANFYVPKSSTASSTARPWIVVADERFFYLFTAFHATYPNLYQMQYFGEPIAWNGADLYGTALMASSAVGGAYPHQGSNQMRRNATAGAGTVKIYAPRSAGGLGTARALGIAGLSSGIGGSDEGMTSTIDTNLGDAEFNGDNVWGPVALTENSQARAQLPGILYPSYNTFGFTSGDTRSDIEGYPGRTFIGINVGGASGTPTTNVNLMMIDITDDWGR